jgi:hypothetical protein
MFCVGSHELQRTVANLGQNLSNLPRTHSRGGRKWRGAGTARRRRRSKMTVPVEEAVAALSTFSLEVQPFSLVFGFLIGFFCFFCFFSFASFASLLLFLALHKTLCTINLQSALSSSSSSSSSHHPDNNNMLSSS